jgi:putative nucleotidyltransferase with HDIG domain
MRTGLSKQLVESLHVFGSLVEACPPYLSGHSWRVSQLAKLFGKDLGWTEGDIFILSMGGFLHDIGKIRVAKEILLKPGPLERDEYEIIKTHPKMGYDLIREHPFGEFIQDIIYHHHERHNGKGYPDSLAQDEISLYSRIIGIVDAFDAMTSPRPYRKALPIGQALSILEKEKDKQFDGKLVSSFLDISTHHNLIHIMRHRNNRLLCGDSPWLPLDNPLPCVKAHEICMGWIDGKDLRVTGNFFSISI